MITSKLQGGLGNQMYQYALGRALALRHNTSLTLDISWYQNSKDRVFELDAFNIKASTSTHSLKPSFFDKIFGKKSLKESGREFDPTILTAPDESYLDGYWQSYHYFSDIRETLLEEFSLKNGLGEKAKACLGPTQESQSVSIHVRRGDYANTTIHTKHNSLPLSYYEKALGALPTNENYHFFVFSDDITWTKENLTLPGATTYIDESVASYESIILMSKCTHNIIANSTFSWWGAWLNTNPDKKVVAPKPWLTGVEEKLEDRLPPEWIRIDHHA